MKCPKCQSENVVEIEPTPVPFGLEGMKPKYKGYDCKKCGNFFRIAISSVETENRGEKYNEKSSQAN